MLHVPRCRPPRCFFFYSSRRHLAIPSWFADGHDGHVKASSSRFVLSPRSKPVPDSTEERQFRQKAASYREGYMKLELDMSDFRTLESLQFAWSKDEDRWENDVVPALLQYKELEGDMHVPYGFVVPSDGDWPEEMWGEKLGSTVSSIRTSGTFVRGDEERRQWLEDNGFECDMHKLRWEKARLALLQYKELEGDMNVPFSFAVPSDGDWPEEMWGEKLGETVASIRSAGRYVRGDEERRQWLEDNGFEFDMHKLSWEKAQRTLLQYKELEGDMNVPARFVVPSGGDWPEEMWGEKLGSTVKSIRSQGHFVRGDEERRQWLEEQGFRFPTNYEESKHSYARWEQAQLALLQYKELEGDMNVPQNFVVPSDGDWPEEMWGEKLGSTVSKIRSAGQFVRGDEERKQWLEDNGFEFDMHRLSWEKARLALLQYKELEGDMNVPKGFVVPSGGDWPEEMWGEKLGSTVSNIRSAGHFVRGDEERRQWLEDNGFEFDMHKLRWETARLALLQYKELEGDMKVPFSFVVPSDGDWPEEMWGEKLGETVGSIRSAGRYVRGDEERRQWLEEQGFVWKVRMSNAERVRAAAEHYGRVRRGAVKRGSSD